MVEAKRKPVIVLVVALTVLAVVGILAGGMGPMSPADMNPVATSRTVLVTLTGDGVAAAEVTTQVGSDSTQETVDLPMEGKRFNVDPGTVVVVTAQMTGESGELSCEITSDGTRISQGTADVPYGVVTCSGAA